MHVMLSKIYKPEESAKIVSEEYNRIKFGDNKLKVLNSLGNFNIFINLYLIVT